MSAQPKQVQPPTPSEAVKDFVPSTTQNDLEKSATAVARVTGYCHAVAKSTISDPPTPVAWYSEFKANMTVAKENASTWLVSLQPALTAGYNEIIASYGEQFMNYSAMLIEQATPYKKDPRPLPKTEREAMINAFKELLEELTSRQKKMNDLYTRLQSFSAAVIKDRANFEKARSQAAMDSTVNKARVKRLRDKIEEIRKNVEANSKTRTSSVLVVVGAAVLAGAAIALTGGAALIILCGLCAGAAIYGGYTGIKAHIELKKDLAEIEELSSTCTREEALIVWLETTEKSIKNLVAEADKAAQALSSIMTAWNTLCEKMNSVIEDLTKANNEKASGMRTVVALSAAHTGWQKLAAVAEAHQRQVFEPTTIEDLAKKQAA